MLKFDEKNELNSVNGALAIRLELEKIVDEILLLVGQTCVSVRNR